MLPITKYSKILLFYIIIYDNNFLELAAFAGFVLCQHGNILPPIKCMLADYHNVLSWIRPCGK